MRCEFVGMYRMNQDNTPYAIIPPLSDDKTVAVQ